MQERDHTFTIAMEPGVPHPTIHGPYAHIKRASDIADMLSLFTGRMPRPLNITYIIDDNPAVMLPYTQRERMVELGQQGECEWTESDRGRRCASLTLAPSRLRSVRIRRE